jgi:hypothetical protein
VVRFQVNEIRAGERRLGEDHWGEEFPLRVQKKLLSIC